MKLDLTLSGKELEKVIKSVAATPDGLKFIGHLISSDISKADVFQGNSRDVYNKGCSEHSLQLSEDLQIYAFEKFLELLKMDKSKREEELAEFKKKQKEEKENEDG